jgi:hypothetical protein
MTVAIHQPNYAPWCGYFTKMAHADRFVFLDDAQISKGSYTSRCLVRSAAGPQWLSVPVSFHLGDLIKDVKCANNVWPRKHLQTLRTLYGRAPCFKEAFSLIEPVYSSAGAFLCDFNIRLITALRDYLGIRSEAHLASHLGTGGESDARLISLVAGLGADTYLSGRGGQNYQDPAKFQAAGITLLERVYNPIPYAQLHGGFVGGLSILDALFNLGRGASGLLRYEAPPALPNHECLAAED